MAAYSEGLLSGVLSSNDLLAEFGPLGSPGSVKPVLWMSANVAATIEFQHRNAANTGNIASHRFFISAASPMATPAPFSQVDLDTGERVRLVLISGLIGAVQGSIYT